MQAPPVRMSAATIDYLALALTDEKVVARYFSHVRKLHSADGQGCDWWQGAVSGRGHGRFTLGTDPQPRLDGRRIVYTVIAHRFGYALRHGLAALLATPVVAHCCDNPLCQRPDHWRESTPSLNRREYYARRDLTLSALADTRGARGRALELRNALRGGASLAELDALMADGAREGHREQTALFELSAHQLALFDAPAPAA
jgi:hypothetical protein